MYKKGDILGGCRLLQECGSGAFGSVFLVENETTHQRMALKILLKTGRHYEREISALTAYQEKCRHANLMLIYHIGQNEDCLFYTMDAADPLNSAGDYVPDTLGNRLRQRKRLPPEEIRTMLNELLNGLEILHNAGLLHRDIKPDNVLWVDGHAVLGDIGLVTASDHASFAGTRGFISPAVWKGERGYSKQDDLYALAMTLYCALTGNEPKGNLELPLSMTFSGCGDLIRAYNDVLDEDSQIHSVADFRAALLKRRNLLSKKQRKRILPAILITVLCTLLAVSFYNKIEPLKDDPVQNRAEEVPNFMKFRSKIKTDPDQAMKTPQKKSAVSEINNTQKTARLAEALEQEWRDSCSERLKKAGNVVFSPINIGQGENARLSYTERKRREQEKALLREAQVRKEIEDEEKYQLPNLKSFAELAIRYFGDVAYNDELVKKNEGLLADFDNPEFLLDYYGDTLCSRASLGLSISWSGELAELDKRLRALPQDERRMRLRCIIFAALRRNYFNGKNLMAMNGFPVRSFPQLDEVERRLSFFNQYIDRY